MEKSLEKAETAKYNSTTKCFLYRASFFCRCVLLMLMVFVPPQFVQLEDRLLHSRLEKQAKLY